MAWVQYLGHFLYNTYYKNKYTSKSFFISKFLVLLHHTKQHNMRKVETLVYKFEELTPDAQQKAIDAHCFINLEHDWWKDTITEDALGTAGIVIEEFDVLPIWARGGFKSSAVESAQHILQNHGESCATYPIAEKFLNDRAELESFPDTEETEALLEGLEDAFLDAILREYAIILSSEYDELCSNNAIKEALIANEYEFTENGDRF